MHCLSWIYAIWPANLLLGSLFTEKDADSCFFSDEILVEILTRLPTESVLECRKVCKHWKTLTTTVDFTRKHLLRQQSTPSILIVYDGRPRLSDFSRDKPHHVLLLNEWEANSKSKSSLKKVMNKLDWYSVTRPMLCSDFLIRCYNNSGMLLFMTTRPLILPCGEFSYSANPLGIASFILFNPVTLEKLVFNTSKGSIVSIFYHPLAGEYRVLFCGNVANSLTHMFKILNLGSQSEQPCWRDLDKFPHLPRFCNETSVLLNNEGCLHWMIQEKEVGERRPCGDSIVVFNINTEKFSTMTHPGDKCHSSWRRHSFMYLLELKKLESGPGSELCLCDCSMKHQIAMWVLEDYEKQIWVKRHIIFIEIKVDSSPNLLDYRLQPFGMHNEEMLILRPRRGIFAYNIRKDTLRKIETRNMGIKEHEIEYVGLHPKSLVSFTNFAHQGLYINMDSYEC